MSAAAPPGRADPVVVFYVSGHAFGHASRVIEIINEIHAQRPATTVIVRTGAAKWLFDVTVRGRVGFHACQCDTGVVQRDSLNLDIPGTIALDPELT